MGVLVVLSRSSCCDVNSLHWPQLAASLARIMIITMILFSQAFHMNYIRPLTVHWQYYCTGVLEAETLPPFAAAAAKLQIYMYSRVLHLETAIIRNELRPLRCICTATSESMILSISSDCAIHPTRIDPLQWGSHDSMKSFSLAI